MTEYAEGQTGTDNATGMRVVYTSGQWVPADDAKPVQQARPAGPDPDVPQVGGVAPADNVDTSGITWPGSGPLAMLDAMPPIIAAPVHGVLASSRLATRAGLEAGALASKAADPIARAFSRAGEMVSGAGTGVLNVVEKSLPAGLSELIGGLRTKAAEKLALRDITQRSELVTAANRMGDAGVGAAQATQRGRPGLLQSTEFEESLGLPAGTLSPTMRADLDQVRDKSGQLVNEVRAARDAEMESLYTKTAGPKALESLQKVRTAYTDKIAELAGVPRGTVPDKGTISATNETTGLEIDEIMRERFPDDVLKMNPERPVSEVLGSSDTSKDVASLLKKYGVIKQTDDGWQDVASLPATELTEVRTKLKKMSEAATEAGDNVKSKTATAALNRLDDMIEEAMPQQTKDELAKLRFKYRVGKRLEKPGVIKEGQVDPGAFGKAWTHGSSKNKRMYDELAILSDTAQEMLRVKHAGNTAKRVLEGAGEAAGAGILSKLAGR